MKLTIAGDSHGKYMIAVLEGIPAGLKIDEEIIRRELFRRRNCYGRGKRMSIEEDAFEIVSGVWRGITTGAPLTILVPNKAGNPVKDVRSVPRPGHIDYAAFVKYKLPDLNVYVERSSARWTVALTAAGALLKSLLREFNIDVLGFVTRLGNVEAKNIPDDFEELRRKRDESAVFCPDPEATEGMISEIDRAKEEGNTLGGKVRIIARGVPAGIGSYSDLFKKLDSKIGSLFFAIPAVKGVVIGSEEMWYGFDYLDEFELEDGKIKRKTNNLGGIEGGITNGEDVWVNVSVKPIPTTGKPLKSVDLRTMEPAKTPYVRSDVTAVPPASVVCEAALAVVISDALLEHLGDGNIDDLKRRFENENLPRWNDGFWKEHYR
ncbi:MULTISPECIES: chorismate synthase [unclassified Thermotoga]|jgi:chorismate synthase|uniref:chorismate synthase n=1 Tax=unclassified Thermotoga TaxID=2631113 RepID=UPI000280E7B3|nr:MULTISPECIES: chorismate synthase [unclassified Thermotoga]AIY86146.1 chorismate synthase [Thermotoga sp. 2812B]EJX26082.1 chorismate synthase [Thermotoga sp. EMP]KAF2959528.1 chorismate synthase [Thermotoga sp. 38H-to]